MTVFGAYARYYDLLYADKDYVAEVGYVNGLIDKYNQGAIRLLEFGSGTGRHASLLAEKGYIIHGVERSPQMLEAASLLAHEKMTFSLGDLTTFKLFESFDVVLALFHVISYQSTNDSLKAAFMNAAEHLNPGGIFIFDCWYGPAVLTQCPETRIKKYQNNSTSIIRTANPIIDFNLNIVDVSYHFEITDLSSGRLEKVDEIHRMRYLFLPEVMNLAEQVGMEIVYAAEFLTDKPLDCNSWGSCFVLRK